MMCVDGRRNSRICINWSGIREVHLSVFVLVINGVVILIESPSFCSYSCAMGMCHRRMMVIVMGGMVVIISRIHCLKVIVVSMITLVMMKLLLLLLLRIRMCVGVQFDCLLTMRIHAVVSVVRG